MNSIDISGSGKVAVLLASYNGADYITLQLESILNQTYESYICFIHDDGSTDGTREIIQNFTKSHPENFRIIEGDSTGSAKNNFLFMLREIKADYYMFCDQDDVWLPEKIEVEKKTLDKCIKRNASSALVYSDLKVVDKDLKDIAQSFYQYVGIDPYKHSIKELTNTNVFVGCTMLFNREVREEAVLLKETQAIFMHDWLIGLMAALNGKICFIQKPLILYRQHGNNEMGAVKHRTFFQRIGKYIRVTKQYKEARYYVLRRRRVAAELVDIAKDTDVRVFLKDLAAIGAYPKYKRINFYLKNKLLTGVKGPSFNKLFQLLAI